MMKAWTCRRIWLTDQLLSWIPGVDHTVINVGFFADNFMSMLGVAAQLGRARPDVSDVETGKQPRKRPFLALLNTVEEVIDALFTLAIKLD